jgi:hypothetical protein
LLAENMRQAYEEAPAGYIREHARAGNDMKAGMGE